MESPVKASHVQTVALATSVTLLAVLGVFWYQKRKRNAVPTVWEAVGKVSGLCLYPLKSGKAIELRTAECTGYGLKQSKQDEKSLQLRDRCLLVYGEGNNEFKTARTYPKMVLIEVSVHDQDHIAVDAPTMRTLYVKIPSLDNNNKEDQISLHRNEKIFTIDCGNEAANWFSRYLLEKDSGLRLGYHDGEHRRNISKTHHKYLKTYQNLGNQATGMYSDLSSYLLVNKTSVDALNEKIPDSLVTFKNFRPNIIVEGENAVAWSEDKWEWIRIGEAVFRAAKPCTRCVLTTVNPATGIRDENREPLKTLEKHRKLKDVAGIELDGRLGVMGVNLGLINPGNINIDDIIYIGRP